MEINLIAAVQTDRGIGYKNDLLWQIPEDMKLFKQLTREKTVIMGRKTWASIPERFRPLPNRDNIVITSQKDFQAPGAEVTHSFPEALKKAKEIGKDVFVIGGQRVYEEALPYADKLYLTLVEGHKPADTFFPDWTKDFKKSDERQIDDEENIVKYSFTIWQNKNR